MHGKLDMTGRLSRLMGEHGPTSFLRGMEKPITSTIPQYLVASGHQTYPITALKAVLARPRTNSKEKRKRFYMTDEAIALRLLKPEQRSLAHCRKLGRPKADISECFNRKNSKRHLGNIRILELNAYRSF